MNRRSFLKLASISFLAPFIKGIPLGDNYFTRLLAKSPDGYWPLNGDTLDYSGNGFNAAATAISYDVGIGDGGQSAVFNGVNSLINPYSVALKNKFNKSVGGNEGSYLAWVKAWDTSLWTDITTSYSVMTIYTHPIIVSYNGLIRMIRFQSSPINNLNYERHTSPFGNSEDAIITRPATFGTDWKCLLLTWNFAAHRIKAYYNGSLFSSAAINVSWAADGDLGTFYIGAGINEVTSNLEYSWRGNQAHVAWWKRELTDIEALDLSIVAEAVPVITPKIFLPCISAIAYRKLSLRERLKLEYNYPL